MAAKHFNWKAEGFGGGRVAVALDGQTIQIAQLAGNAPPATPRFLAALVTEDEYAGCGNAHARRVNPWAIEPRYGMSGAIDLRLRVLEDPALADAPIKNILHVSMHGKLNQGYRGWIGDFWAMMEHWPLPEDQLVFSVEEAPIFQPASGWNRPESWGEEYPIGEYSVSETLEKIMGGISADEVEYAPDTI